MLKLILLSWILGIASMGSSLPSLVSIWPALFILSLILVGLIQLKWVKTDFLAIKIVQVILFVSTAFSSGHYYADHALTKRLQFRETQPQQVDVVVYADHLSEFKEETVQQKVQVLGRHAKPVQWLLLMKSSGYRSPFSLKLGQYYRIQGALKPAHSYATSGAFDQEKWWLQQNVMAGLRVAMIQPLTTEQVAALGFSAHQRQQQGWWMQFRLQIEQLRYGYREFIQHQPLVQKGLLLGLLTGDRSLLSAHTEAQFQRLGISHLLAISGPHVLIFALLVSWLLQRIIRCYRPQLYLKWPKVYVLMLPFLGAVLGYCAFVGFEIPALRTLLMSIVTVTVILLQQPLRSLSILLLSASILLLFDPWSVLSAAFWLSFGASFILLRIYQTLQQQPLGTEITGLQRFFQHFRLLVESQGKIFIALLPLVLIFFQQFSWIAPLANILTIPILAGVIVPLNIVSACLYLVWEPFGSLGFQITDHLLNLMMYLLNGMEHLFNPQLHRFAVTPLMIVLLGLGMLLLFLPRGVVPKAWSALAIVPVFLGFTTHPQWTLHILDVGQGQAIVLEDGQHKLMIDTGGYYREDRFSIGQQVVLPYLSRQGITQLQQLFLSHLDQDHSGALAAVLQGLPVQQILANETMPDVLPQQFQYCHVGQQWRFEHSQLRVLSPTYTDLAKVKSNRNEYSCVLYLQVIQAQGIQNFLIMGDAGWETEYQLLQRYPDLKVDVLVLGHHGSRHSSSYAFLQQLKPKLAVASVGWDNRYGHPSQELQARLRELGIPLLTTAQAGTLQFQLNEQEIKLRTHRQQWRWLQREPVADAVLRSGL